MRRLGRAAIGGVMLMLVATLPSNAAPGGHGGGGGGGGGTAPSISVGSIGPSSAPEPWLCRLTIGVTATGLKKSTSVTARIDGGSTSTIGTLGKADNGILRLFGAGTISNDAPFLHTLVVTLFDGRKTIATDSDDTFTSSCDPFIEITSVDVVPNTGFPGSCLFQGHIYVRGLPDPTTTYVIWVHASDATGAGTTGAELSQADIGTTVDRVVGGDPDDGSAPDVWLTLSEHANPELQFPKAQSNTVQVVSSCST